MSKTCRSDALAAIHETASDLHDAGVMNKRTLRELDDLCLASVRPMTAADIRALSRRERVSQTVFARYLNVTTGLVSQWERGENHPAGASLKLLNLGDRRSLAAIAREGGAGKGSQDLSAPLRDTCRAADQRHERVRELILLHLTEEALPDVQGTGMSP